MSLVIELRVGVLSLDHLSLEGLGLFVKFDGVLAENVRAEVLRKSCMAITVTSMP